MDKKNRSNFSGRLGYVLAAAGSAVGLGNIWRFPYLAAKYGGGIFLLIYLILVVTFGYTMIMAETSLGRMTGKAPVGAFKHFGNSLPIKLGGWVNSLIPLIIVSYYSVIGGWVLRYLFAYLRGAEKVLAGDSFFTSFIGDGRSVIFWFVVFAAANIIIILAGVEKGIERVSTLMMPVLVVLAVIVAIYSVTRPGAMAGVKYFLIPNFRNFSWMTVVAALGQMFYSLSIAMGILITFGSYMRKDIDIEKATTQVEIFDTAIAILAGLMIIPAVFAFSGGEASALNAGPSLMFITMPKVFTSMGFGTPIGIVFFLLVFFAALTSSIALLESVVATVVDEFHWNRKVATLVFGAFTIALGTLSCLGFNVLSDVTIIGMGFLDFFDFLTNSIMMPIAAIAICLIILKKITLAGIAAEIESSSKFRRKKLFNFFMKYLCIIFIAIILVSSVLNVFGIIKI